MGTKRLGLPPEYKKQPEYFDAWNISEDTDAKNAFIESLLRPYGIKTVLDMTCGTGSQVFHLLKLGYEVTGSDFSPKLLEIARIKAQKAGVKTQFIDGDVRTLQVGQFDAVITMFNAVGHLTKPGFAKAIRNIGRNLKPGGIYLFDIFNLEAMTDAVVADFAYFTHKKMDNRQFHVIQFSTIDRDAGRLTSYNHQVVQHNVEVPVLSKSTFALQLYKAEELEGMLKKAGFDVIGKCSMDGSTFIKDQTISMLTIAKKR